jgi:hypothetical protein
LRHLSQEFSKIEREGKDSETVVGKDCNAALTVYVFVTGIGPIQTD